MALPRQIKSKEKLDKISKMRREVLREIKRDEMAASSRQAKENQENSKINQFKKRSVKKKEAIIAHKDTDKQKKVFVPKPKAVESSIDVKEVAEAGVESTFPKEVLQAEKMALKPKEDGENKLKPYFFCSKTLKTKEARKSDYSKSKLDSINSVVDKQTEPARNSRIINIFALFFFGLILGCLVFAALIFYVPKSESLLARKISKAVPLPAIIIDGKIISYNDYLKEVDTVDLFLIRQQRLGIIREIPPHDQIRGEVRDLLIKQEIIAGLSNQYKITVSQKEIDDEINKIKEQSRSQESFDMILKDLYGWSENDFGNKVARNYLLISKLSNKIFPEVPIEESKGHLDKKIEEIKRGINIYVLVE